MPGVVMTRIINVELFLILFQVNRIIIMTRILWIKLWGVVGMLTIHEMRQVS